MKEQLATNKKEKEALEKIQEENENSVDYGRFNAYAKNRYREKEEELDTDITTEGEASEIKKSKQSRHIKRESINTQTAYDSNNKNFEIYNSTNPNEQSMRNINPNNKNFDIYLQNVKPSNQLNNNQITHDSNYNTTSYKNNSQNNSQNIQKAMNQNMNRSNVSTNQSFNKDHHSRSESNKGFNYNPIGLNNKKNDCTLNIFTKNIPEDEDPLSCSNCQGIYKMAIFNNMPLKILKCVVCGNIINNNSLGYYLKKYKDELVQSKMKQLKVKEESGVKRAHDQSYNESNESLERIEKINDESKKKRRIKNYSYSETTQRQEEVKEKEREVAGEGGIDDPWVKWIDLKKKNVKENLIYSPVIKRPRDLLNLQKEKELKQQSKHYSDKIHDNTTTDTHKIIEDQDRSNNDHSNPSMGEILKKQKNNVKEKNRDLRSEPSPSEIRQQKKNKKEVK